MKDRVLIGLGALIGAVTTFVYCYGKYVDDKEEWISIVQLKSTGHIHIVGIFSTEYIALSEGDKWASAGLVSDEYDAFALKYRVDDFKNDINANNYEEKKFNKSSKAVITEEDFIRF